jgi:hypothetical protein
MLDTFGSTNAPPPVAKLASLCSTTSPISVALRYVMLEINDQ